MEKKTINNKEYFSHKFNVDVKVFEGGKSKELLASLSKLAGFLNQDINFEENIDLVPIAFDAFVVNRRNKNNQVIGTEKALEIVNNFKYKFINIEHNRENIIGVILGTGFSSFGEDSKVLTLDDVKDTKDPFNVVAHGIMWKIVDQDLVEIIEDSGNVLSKNYKKISASWELLSTDCEVALFEKDEKNLINASVSKDDKFKKYLYTEGGKGETPDGKIVCNLISGDTLPLGVGLTTDPAAEVEGVLTASNSSAQTEYTFDIESTIKSFMTESLNENKQLLAEIQEKINNLEKNSVYTIKENNIMTIDNIDQLTDENIKELKASNIQEIHNKIKDELKSVSEKYVSDKKNLEDEIKASKEAMESALLEAKNLKEKVKQLEDKVNEFEASEAQRIAEETYNSRMETIESKFEINDASRKVIAKKLQSISSDEEFSQYEEELSVFLSAKTAKTEEEIKDPQEVIASAFDTSERTNETVNTAKPSDNERSVWEKAAQGIRIKNLNR